MSEKFDLIRAQARLHHAYLLGLQLMVSVNHEPALIEKWMFRLFRRQHEEKFLSSFEKLGLTDLPDAVACAHYHVLSNSLGGVGVEFMAETDRKAWVRFRYPRWMYFGPTICGVPNEVGRGFLRGWYAHNGVSLRNPKLGFVCVSEDMTGEFGFCGYFQEYDHELSEQERLRFAKDELPPPFKQEDQPAPPEEQWNEERMEKANRNYSVEFIRNALLQLEEVLGSDKAQELGGKSARLIGLQYFQETRELVETEDGDLDSAASYLQRMFQGMGDSVEIVSKSGSGQIELIHSGLRIVRDLKGSQKELVLNCWQQLWVGAMSSFRQRKQLQCDFREDKIYWTLSTAESASETS
jgi:hypothetical protein